MIDKITFKATEAKLYDFFRKDKIIIGLKTKIELLQSQISAIDNKLKKIDIDIPEESHEIRYEARIQTSVDNTSYAEKTAIKITDRLLQEKGRKEEKIQEAETQIRDIEANSIMLSNNINGLGIENTEFLKAKYSEKVADWQVASKLYMERCNVSRKKQKLVNKIAEWEALTSNIN